MYKRQLVTFLPARSHSSSHLPEPTLLTHYQGLPVEAVELSPREESFAKNFPGELNIYRIAGQQTLIIRRVTKATRMLHPSSHCLKAEGFKISQSSIARKADGRPYLRYHATRRDEAYLVTEQISDQQNRQQWTEVSAWYWAALCNPQSGPWQAETLLTPLTQNHD